MKCLLACRYLLLAGLFLFASGCGGGKGDVSGTVTYRGQPLKFGSVQFQVPGGPVLTSEIDAQGHYKIEGIGTGTAKILVSCVDPAAVDYAKMRAAGGKGTGDPGKGGAMPAYDPMKYIITPLEYAEFSTSGLTFEVKSGANTHNIDLIAK